MDIVRIIYISVLLVLFSISLSWTIFDRISYWPHIRRFGSWRALLDTFRYLRTRHPVEIYQFELKFERFFIFLFSWLIIFISVLIIMACSITYYENFHDPSLVFKFKNYIIVPLSMIFLPHLIGRLIESFAFIIGPKEFFFCKTFQPKSFDCYLKSWKEENGFSDSNTDRFLSKMKGRFIFTLLFILLHIALIVVNSSMFL